MRHIDMKAQTKNLFNRSFKKSTLSTAIFLTLLSPYSTAFASCTSGYPNGVLVAKDGAQCTANKEYYNGNNVVSAYGEGTTLTFTAKDVTIQSITASTLALSVGGENGGVNPKEAGATITANNLTVSGSSGSNSRSIYIYDGLKTNTLNVENDLTINQYSRSGGSAIQIAGKNGVINIGNDLKIVASHSDAIRNQGEIYVGGKAVISSPINAISNSGTITFRGNLTSNGNIQNNASSEMYLFGLSNTLKGNVSASNNSLISLSNDELGGNLTIDGNYNGTNSTLHIDTQLDSDDSKTDFINIKGQATGSTQLEINNVGGKGAQTVNGIHIIKTDSSESDKTFYLKNGYISAGAYDYSLHLNKSEVQDNETFDNWYLKSQLQNGGSPDQPIYTPNMGSYLTAEMMGNTLFTSRLEDREGASNYQNLEKNNGNVWIRTNGRHNQFKSMSNQLKTSGDSIITQIGTGLVTLGNEDQYNIGSMVGYAHYNGETKSKLTNRTSKTSIDGYSVGLYGTWYAYPVEQRGAYIDSWILWNSFNNKIDTADKNNYEYDSSGITASIEVGGNYLINNNWWIQPQTQIIYQGVHADKFKDDQGLIINHGSDNLQARLGFKTYLEVATSINNETSYRPYLALNYIHNTSPYSVDIDNIKYMNNGSKNLGEVKIGIEGNITKNNQVWLNTSYIEGGNSNHEYQGTIGWKYNF